MKVIGVTGCVGVGKSTVCELLTQRGYIVLDVDVVAADALEVHQNEVLEIMPNTENSAGFLSKRKVMLQMFTEPALRKQVDALLLPTVKARIAEWKKGLVMPGVLDAALLFEGGLDAFCDETITLTCPTEIRRQRVTHRGTVSAQIFDAIEAAQLTEAEKCARATFTLSTNQDRSEIAKQLPFKKVEGP